MIKFMTLALASMMALATFQTAYADENLRKQAIETVVMIDNDCSAVNIGNKKLLTAAHCSRNKVYGKIVSVKYTDLNISEEHNYWYDVKKVDIDRDIALLIVRSNEFNVPVAKLASNLLAMEGDEVFTVGYPGMTGRTVTEGLFNDISVIQYPIKMNKRYRATPPIYGGNSGGGLFQHDGKGGYELIGITNATFKDVPHLAIYTPIDDIVEFLKGT